MSGDKTADSVANNVNDRERYTLEEDLVILDMIADKQKLPAISKALALVGIERSPNTLRYRYKSKERGIGPVHDKGGVEAVFAYHKKRDENTPDFSQTVVDQIVADFKARLVAATPEATEEETATA